MADKNIFAYKLFLSLNISDFNFFYVKVATHPEKSHPLFPGNPPLKIEVLSSPPPPFSKIWLEAQPPSPAERGGCAHYGYVYQQVCEVVQILIYCSVNLPLVLGTFSKFTHFIYWFDLRYLLYYFVFRFNWK